MKLINRYILLFFFSFAISTMCLTTSTAAERDKTIIAFGDSITQGWFLVMEHTPGDRVGGYQPYLEVLSDDIKNHYDVLNYGFGGERTVYDPDKPEYKGGFERLKRDVLPAHPKAEYILIMEGTNDLWSGISQETTVYTLGEMTRYAVSYGMIPILGTITPDTRQGIQELKNLPALNNKIRAVAVQKDVTIADFYPAMISKWNSLYASDSDPVWNPTLGKFQGDLIHPSSAGYEKMAEMWFEALELPIPSTIFPTWWLHLLLQK